MKTSYLIRKKILKIQGVYFMEETPRDSNDRPDSLQVPYVYLGFDGITSSHVFTWRSQVNSRHLGICSLPEYGFITDGEMLVPLSPPNAEIIERRGPKRQVYKRANRVLAGAGL